MGAAAAAAAATRPIMVMRRLNTESVIAYANKTLLGGCARERVSVCVREEFSITLQQHGLAQSVVWHGMAWHGTPGRHHLSHHPARLTGVLCASCHYY